MNLCWEKGGRLLSSLLSGVSQAGSSADTKRSDSVAIETSSLPPFTLEREVLPQETPDLDPHGDGAERANSP